MGMKGFLVLGLLALLPGNALRSVRTIVAPAGISWLANDGLGNTLAITDKGELLRFDTAGKQAANFREMVNGRLAYVDATNPLDILAFYPETARILFLDNMLYPKARFDLFQLGFGNHSVACRSEDGNVWLWDERNFQLLKVDRNMQLLQKGQSLQNQSSQALAPTFLVEANRLVYMNCPGTGVFLFDFYGGYLKTLPWADLTDFSVAEGALWARRGPAIVGFSLLAPLADTLPVVCKGAFAFGPNKRLAMADSNHILLFNKQ
jgi:hypothetical protein